MSDGMVISVSGELERWTDGFEELATGPSEEMRRAWEQACEFWYAESQAIVHVVTGRLKASGEMRNEQHGDTLYGRYWGATERLSGLYFNLAFYAPIRPANSPTDTAMNTPTGIISSRAGPVLTRPMNTT